MWPDAIWKASKSSLVRGRKMHLRLAGIAGDIWPNPCSSKATQSRAPRLKCRQLLKKKGHCYSLFRKSLPVLHHPCNNTTAHYWLTFNLLYPRTPCPFLQSHFPAGKFLSTYWLVPWVIHSQGQEFSVLGFHEVPVSPFLQTVPVTLSGSVIHWYILCSNINTYLKIYWGTSSKLCKSLIISS